MVLGVLRDQGPHLENRCSIHNLAFGEIRREFDLLKLLTGFLHQARLTWNNFHMAHFRASLVTKVLTPEGHIWQMMILKDFILKCFTAVCELHTHFFSSQKQWNIASGWHEWSRKLPDAVFLIVSSKKQAMKSWSEQRDRSGELAPDTRCVHWAVTYTVTNAPGISWNSD